MTRALNILPLLCVWLVACAWQDAATDGAGPPLQVSAELWPEADRLFYANPDSPLWKGADVANSVALGDGRILWVFGDTLLADPDANRCERFAEPDLMVHNSLALQQGADPTTARITHYWGQRGDRPASFFEPVDDDGSWYWMGGVTVIGQQALVFLMRALSTVTGPAGTEPEGACAGLNFEMLGWDARIADITAQPPDQWQWRAVRLPQDVNWQGILVGSSTVYVEDDYLYAWSAGPATLAGNPVYLARWPVDTAARADLGTPQWHTVSGWTEQAALDDAAPLAIVEDGNNEISVGLQQLPGGAPLWLWLQSREVVNSSLCYRIATSPLAFGECRSLLTPPELRKYPHSQLLVYAVKLHPALGSPDDDAVVATYVVNGCSLQDLQTKCELYYPRFIRLRVQP